VPENKKLQTHFTVHNSFLIAHIQLPIEDNQKKPFISNKHQIELLKFSTVKRGITWNVKEKEIQPII